MAKQTDHGISYAQETWNPLRGCDPKMKCAPTCWACRMANRHRHSEKYAGFTRIGKHGPEWTGKVALIEDELTAPLHMRKPRRIAVGLMGDWMRLPREDRDKILAVEALCPQHEFLHLTKCPREMAYDFTDPERPAQLDKALLWAVGLPANSYGGRMCFVQREGVVGYPLPNIALGVSCLDQSDADAAREPMRQLAAAGWFTWVSHEPAWSGIDWRGWEFLRYMVSGGQSGPKARPSHPDCFRADRDWCAANSIPWMFKQWGAARPWTPTDPRKHSFILLKDGRKGVLADLDRDACPNFVKRPQIMVRVTKRAAGRLLDGREHLELPEVRRA